MEAHGISWAIMVIGGLTLLSGVVAPAVMAETLPRMQQTQPYTK